MPDRLALALSGGGARAAYQAGVLRGLARIVPELEASYLTGISAGAINAAHLANHTGPLDQALDELTQLWREVSLDDVFEVRDLRLFGHAARILWRLSTGTPPERAEARGLVDTGPLASSLRRWLKTEDGLLRGVRENLARGRLRAVALTATRYATGQTVTFFEGDRIDAWERPQRLSRGVELTVDHVMASAALPLFFPAVRLADGWYGDGGMRLVAPLAPALHLGADRILAISTRYDRSADEAERETLAAPPSPARILGVLFNAVFLDQLDQDALHLRRVNQLLDQLPVDRRHGLRPVNLFVIRPSVDLGLLAAEVEPRLPRVFRFLMRRLGGAGEGTQDLLSHLLFQSEYVERLLEVGERDGERQGERFAEFLAGSEDGGAT